MPILRNPGGFSALPRTDPLADLDVGNPRKWAIFFEDFLAYDIGQAAGNPYTFTATGGVDTIVGPTGVLNIIPTNTDNNLGQLQLTEAPFQTNSKRMYFEARWKLKLGSSGTVAANELYVGLASEQTGTNFMNSGGTAMEADDTIGFVKYDTVTTLEVIQSENNTGSLVNSTTATGLHTVVDDTYMTTAFYFDGTNTRFYVDSTLVATLTTNVATSILTPTMYIKLGEGVANELHVDYFLVASER